jgi:hypothetical protein
MTDETGAKSQDRRWEPGHHRRRQDNCRYKTATEVSAGKFSKLRFFAFRKTVRTTQTQIGHGLNGLTMAERRNFFTAEGAEATPRGAEDCATALYLGLHYVVQKTIRALFRTSRRSLGALGGKKITSFRRPAFFQFADVPTLKSEDPQNHKYVSFRISV